MKTPNHWIKGQLLDVRKYTDGTYHAKLAHEGKKPNGEEAEMIIFESSEQANQFLSKWYSRE